jgi:hypothetical protein
VVEKKFLNRVIELAGMRVTYGKRSESRQFQHTAPFIRRGSRLRDLDRFFPASREGAASAKLFSGTLNRSARVAESTTSTRDAARNKIAAARQSKARTDHQGAREVSYGYTGPGAARD